jgi:alpha-tubulin suppressor-like RCC1 family protein
MSSIQHGGKGDFNQVDLPDVRITKIAECQGNFLLIDEDGKTYSVGRSNKYGILGRGHECDKDAGDILPVKGLENEFVKDVAISTNHCLALTCKGDVYSWGLGLDGAVGYELQNLEACQLIPNRVEIPVFVQSIFISPMNSGFISNDGQLYTCGHN